jgi:hypothetical protein
VPEAAAEEGRRAHLTIADMAIWPWYGGVVKGWLYEAAEFLDVQSYRNVVRRVAVDRILELRRRVGVEVPEAAAEEGRRAHLPEPYTIADMAIWPWYGGVVKGWLYEAAEFLDVQSYRSDGSRQAPAILSCVFVSKSLASWRS